MKAFFEAIFSFLWDVSIDFYKWAHSSFSETHLIIVASILLIIGIGACGKIITSKFNWFGGIFFALMFVMIYGISLAFMFGVYFRHWSDLYNYSGWISMILVLIVTLSMIVTGIANKGILYTIAAVFSIYISCLLFGEHTIWAFLVLLGVLFGGSGLDGSNFIGTFKDNFGNLFDVYRRD